MEIGKSIESARFTEKDASTLTSREMGLLAARFFRYLMPYLSTFLLGCFFALLHAGTAACQPYFLKVLIDDVLRKNDLAKLKWLLLLIMVTALVKGVLMYAQGYLIAYAGQSAVRSIRNEVYGHVQMLPLTFFEKWKTGQIMYRIITDIHQMTETLTSSIPVAIADFFIFLFSVSAMIYMDWRMTIVAFVASPAIAFIMHYFGAQIQKHVANLQREVSHLNAIMQENINGIKVVKAFGAEAREKEKFSHINEKSFNSVMKSIQFRLTQTPLVEVLGTFGIIIILGLGAYLVSVSHFSTGNLIAFCAYMLIATSPVNRFSTTYADIRKGMVSAVRVFEIIDFPVETRDRDDALEVSRVEGKVEFRNVSFAYEGSNYVLRNISLVAHPGEVIAIVGPNGSGKSTLVNLIPRFYELREGQILLDDIDISSIKVRSLRRHIGLMQQEVILFSGTVQENILFGSPEAHREKMEEAAALAKADEFIGALKGGYDFEIGERGNNLSGGQRQRISLARTLLTSPTVLILDEATSSLDQKSEASIYESVMELRKRRTTFVIAHRLSTITRADRIVVLSNGTILESGSHSELIARGGLYRKLFEAQKVLEEEPVLPPLP
ncbi:MAG: ABC transporter ATP-binding protein [Candidatus Eremiobacteraeota bacterium]|nr:ABC transporter ATP-binding protein [Candidatus Eremiobacteraeota bacterium]